MRFYWFWLFLLYSFGGYVLEKLYAAVRRSPHQVRKCFLLLPLCPVYGLAMLAVLARVDNKLPPPVSAFQGIVGREPYPVADKAAEVLRRLLTGGVTRFLTLFRGSRSRSEVVASFLAELELCKARRLRLAGAQEDCTVTCTQEGEVPLDLTADREPS